MIAPPYGFLKPALKTLVLMAGLLLLSGRTYAEDRQIRPFIGATFGGATTFLDLDHVVGEPNRAIGASAVFLGELFGVDIDVADAPGYFESDGKHLVFSSRVTTISTNVVVAAPHRRTEYSLRPYLVGGGGLMRISMTTSLNVFDVSSVIPAFDVGAGVVGFLTNRTGVCWEIRRFQSVGSNAGNTGLSLGDERLSFWRATMGVVIRY
jgi:hypothetical protein